jgi:transposase
MAKPYSDDLRMRVVAAVEGGARCWEAAELFSVGISSVVRWTQRFRESGNVSALPMGGDHNSRLGGERDWLLARIEAAPDLTLEEIRRELADRGTHVGYGTVWRFFAKENITFKKNTARRRAGSA